MQGITEIVKLRLPLQQVLARQVTKMDMPINFEVIRTTPDVNAFQCIRAQITDAAITRSEA